jgi:hypothetical protein
VALGPTLNGYIAWLQAQGFTTNILPTNSPNITYSYNIALQLVNKQIKLASGCSNSAISTYSIYALCVFNLALSNLIQWQQDNPEAEPPPPNADTFWFDLREKWKIDSFTPGIVQSSGDEGSNVSWQVQEQLKSLTIANLQNLKDPWGRWYLGQAQAVGTLWGLS